MTPAEIDALLAWTRRHTTELAARMKPAARTLPSDAQLREAIAPAMSGTVRSRSALRLRLAKMCEVVARGGDANVRRRARLERMDATLEKWWTG